MTHIETLPQVLNGHHNTTPVDNFPHAAILATGSALLDLANKISEPLTGRSVNAYFGRPQIRAPT